MPPPTPPPDCVGWGIEAHHDDPDHPGADGEPLRLQLDGPARLSAAHAKVHALYDLAGELHAFINADLSTYPHRAMHNFSIVVRFSADDHDGLVGDDAAWAVEQSMSVTAVRPAFETLGAHSFTVKGVRLVPGERVRMELST